MAVQIHVQPRFHEVMELNRWAWQQRIKGYIIVGFGLVMVVGCVLHSYLDENSPEPTPGVLAGGLFVLIGLSATRVAGAGTWLFKRAWRPYLVEVSPEGVAVTPEGQGRVFVGWELLKPYYETPNLLVLPIPATADAVAIPKRYCSEEELTELRELLTQQGKAAPATN